jgi:hypothetical protein
MTYEQKMTAAFITAALASDTDNCHPNGGEPLDANFNASHIDANAAAIMFFECKRFSYEQAIFLENVSAEVAGYCFYHARNGSGVGFWDRDDHQVPGFDQADFEEQDMAEHFANEGEVGITSTNAIRKALNRAAEAFHPCSLYIGDDERTLYYFTEAPARAEVA